MIFMRRKKFFENRRRANGSTLIELMPFAGAENREGPEDLGFDILRIRARQPLHRTFVCVIARRSVAGTVKRLDRFDIPSLPRRCCCRERPKTLQYAASRFDIHLIP